ncbi:sigma-E factor negative regulatory protein [Oceanobacter mangrovi]|uniref:sigma-E factor negative regulatory protein n=1 Tax=Oceanobacter mangrovi TaxID=2862510 RepID=UPI001C8EED57|nr:sigma-E factor negative regulatory protein [Oceanobacter mangrovi]
MNDRMNESLSALVDGEADELEVRRVLNQIEEDDELRERWSRYQLMGALLRDEQAMTVDLSKGIMQAIDGEPMDEVPARSSAAVVGTDVVPAVADEERKISASWKNGWIASGAVAASVTLAVLLGVRVVDESMIAGGTEVASAVTINAAPAAAPVMSTVASAPAELVAANSDSAAMADSQLSESELRDAQQRLQEYVLQHSENASLNNGRGLMPYARVTSFEQEGEAQQ